MSIILFDFPKQVKSQVIKSQARVIQGDKKNTAFWIETNDNELLSQQVIQFVAQRSSLVVLRTPFNGIDNGKNYKQVVHQFHQSNPNIPILTYQWATRLKPDSNIIEGYTLKDFKSPESLLNFKRGKLPGEVRGVVYTDITQPSFQNWIISRVQSTLSEVGSDGVAFDLSFRMVPPALTKRLCLTEPDFCKKYAGSMDILFSKIKSKLKPKLVIYNGIWNAVSNINFSEQVKLLEYTDGAAIEYFGLRPKPEESSFQNHILPYIKLAQSRPDKIFLFFGRGPWEYKSYQEDYAWQRYLYACYLLGSGPNTYFKYHNSFQVPPHAGRSGGLDYYSDWDIDLGNPLSSYVEEKGLYIRSFSKGLVLVAPQDGGKHQYNLTKTLYTPEGKRVSGKIDLLPGEAYILLNSVLPTIKSFELNFDKDSTIFNDWPQAQVKIEPGKNKYLHLNTLPINKESRHDLILDGIRRLNPPLNLALKVRTIDPKAKLLLVAEVDDPTQGIMESGIEINADSKISSSNIPGEEYLFAFRLNNSRSKKTYFKYSLQKIPTNGIWKNFTFKSNELDPKYKVKRWKYIRFIGSLDLDDIEIK